ncbi:hypothetical protein H4R35_007059 [Dimargaris xerosporica]|nr:hypothetical protein H4R35_007059 [Dimargaris xerosporica]
MFRKVAKRCNNEPACILRHAPLEYPNNAVKQQFTAYFESLSLAQVASLIPSVIVDMHGMYQSTLCFHKRWDIQLGPSVESPAGLLAGSEPTNALLEATHRGQVAATIAVLKKFEQYYVDLSKSYGPKLDTTMKDYLRGAVTKHQLKSLLRLSRQDRIRCKRIGLEKLEMVYIYLVFKRVYEAALVSPSNYDGSAVLSYLADHCLLPNISLMAGASTQIDAWHDGPSAESAQLPP